MNEVVIKFYRRLLTEDFPNAKEIIHPSVFVEAVGQKMIDCGNTGNYMQLYLIIADGRIEEIKYLCACEPVANVAVEILCDLARGKTLQEAAAIKEESFYQLLNNRDDELRKKVQGILELLNEGISSYHP
jgi:NifU-like protein involved in Fe-S cluster formation